MPTFFGEQNMVASSVTGVGPGESHGKYKPENNCGCGCSSANSNVNVTSSKINNCYNNKINIGNCTKSIKIC
jgi:hypothetical protein